MSLDTTAAGSPFPWPSRFKSLANWFGLYRFATELAGRKARRRTWDGLGEEIARAGWFDS